MCFVWVRCVLCVVCVAYGGEWGGHFGLINLLLPSLHEVGSGANWVPQNCCPIHRRWYRKHCRPCPCPASPRKRFVRLLWLVLWISSWSHHHIAHHHTAHHHTAHHHSAHQHTAHHHTAHHHTAHHHTAHHHTAHHHTTHHHTTHHHSAHPLPTLFGNWLINLQPTQPWWLKTAHQCPTWCASVMNAWGPSMPDFLLRCCVANSSWQLWNWEPGGEELARSWLILTKHTVSRWCRSAEATATQMVDGMPEIICVDWHLSVRGCLPLAEPTYLSTFISSSECQCQSDACLSQLHSDRESISLLHY